MTIAHVASSIHSKTQIFSERKEKNEIYWLRGGGCGSSIDYVGVEKHQFPSLPTNIAKQLSDFTKIIVEKAQFLMDQNEKEEAFIAIQWFYFNQQHFNTLCYKPSDTAQIYELILQCLEQLLKQSTHYLRVSGFICVYILSICNCLMRVIFSFLLKDKKQKNRYLEFQYKEQLQQHLNVLENLFVSESSNVWVKGIQFELLMINTALEHCPTNSAQKEELFSQFMNGMFESIFQLSPSQELIKSLIDIGSTIIQDQYNKYYKHQIRKYEVYYYFETLKWEIINQLKFDYSVKSIISSLEEGYKTFVEQSKDWIIHFCWIRMISELMSFRPIVDKSENQITNTLKSQWNALISNKQIAPLCYNRNQARILFKRDMCQPVLVNKSFSLFYTYLINYQGNGSLKLWREYISFSFKNQNQNEIKPKGISINKFLFGNFLILKLQVQNSLRQENLNEFLQSIQELCQQLKNYENENVIATHIRQIYENEIDFQIKILKQSVSHIYELIILSSVSCQLLKNANEYLIEVIQGKIETGYNQKKEEKNDKYWKKESLNEKFLKDLIKIKIKCYLAISNMKTMVLQFPKFSDVLTAFEEITNDLSSFKYQKAKFELSKNKLFQQCQDWNQLQLDIEEIIKFLIFLQKSYHQFINKQFLDEKQDKRSVQKVIEDFKNLISLLSSYFSELEKSTSSEYTLNCDLKDHEGKVYDKCRSLYNKQFFMQRLIYSFLFLQWKLCNGFKKFLSLNIKEDQIEKVKTQKIECNEIFFTQRQRLNNFLLNIDLYSENKQLLNIIDQFQLELQTLNLIQQNTGDQFELDFLRGSTQQIIKNLFCIFNKQQFSVETLEGIKQSYSTFYQNKLKQNKHKQEEEEDLKMVINFDFINNSDVLQQMNQNYQNYFIVLKAIMSFCKLRNSLKLEEKADTEFLADNLTNQHKAAVTELIRQLESFKKDEYYSLKTNSLTDVKYSPFQVQKYFEQILDFQFDEAESESIFASLQKKFSEALGNDVEKSSANQDGYEVRECLVFSVIKMQSIVPEIDLGQYCSEIIYEIWGRNGREKTLLLNKEMVNMQKQMFSQDLQQFSEKVNEIAQKKLNAINDLELQIEQEDIIKKKEELKQSLVKKYQEFEQFIAGITDMSSKLDLSLQFLKDITHKLTQISQKIDKISFEVAEIKKDIRSLKGKTFEALLLLRKTTIIEQQENFEIRNIYVGLRTQEWNPLTGQKINGVTDLLSDLVEDDKAEVNEFLYFEKYKDVLLIRGEAGSGKSRAARKIEEFLWKQQKDTNSFKERWIPILISLPSIREPRYNLIQQALESEFYNFDQFQITDFFQAIASQKLQIVLILEGYDEMKLEIIQNNLYLTNNFNLKFKNQRFKLIYTTRNEILTAQNYRNWFCGSDIEFLKEIELLSFSDKQIEDYLEMFSILNVKRIYLEIYEFFLESQNLSFNISEFNSDWGQFQEILEKRNKDSDSLLTDYDIVNFTQVMRKQALFKRASQENIVNITKELKVLWSVQKFQKTIKNINIKQILTTPFMMEIIVQVLPNMIEYFSDVSRVKDYFFQQFVQVKSLFLKEQQLIQKYHVREQNFEKVTLNENCSIEQMKKNWEILEQQNFFTKFSIGKNIQFYSNCRSDEVIFVQKEELGIDTFPILRTLSQIQLSSYDFYDTFISQYHEKQIQKHVGLGENFNYDSLKQDLNYFSINLALDLTKNQLSQVSYKIKGKLPQKKFINNNNQKQESWEEFYFNDLGDDGEYKKLIRSCTLLSQKGSIFSFSHKSIQEFFVAKHFFDFFSNLKIIDERKLQNFIDGYQNYQYMPHNELLQQFYNEQRINTTFLEEDFKEIWEQLIDYLRDGDWNRSEFNFSDETFKGCINLMEKKIQNISNFKQILVQQIQLGKYFPQFIQSSSNSIFLLNQMNEYFGGLDLSKIKISNTNLSRATFFNTNLEESKFINVNLSCCNFNGANLKKVQWQKMSINNVQNLQGHSQKINDIKLFQKYKFASGGDDAKVNIWNLQAFKLITTFTEHTAKVNQLEVFDNEQKLVSIGDDRKLVIYSLSEDQYKVIQILSLQNLNFAPLNIVHISFRPLFIVGTKTSNIIIDFFNKQYRNTNQIFIDAVINAQTVSSNQQFQFYAIAVDKVIMIYKNTKKYMYEYMKRHFEVNSIQTLKFSLNNQLLISGSINGTIIIIDFHREIILSTINESENPIISISMLKNEQQNNGILSFADGKYVYIWDIEQNKIITKLSNNKCNVTVGELANFDTNTNLIIYGGDDATIRCKVIESDQDKKDRLAHQQQVTTLSISPDGLTVATGSKDQLVKIWDLETGQLKFQLDQHQSCILQVKFSKNGQMLATIAQDAMPYIYETNLYSIRLQVKQEYFKNKNHKKDSTIFVKGLKSQNVRNYTIDVQKIISVIIGLNDCLGYSFVLGTDDGLVYAQKNEQLFQLWMTHNQITSLDFEENEKLIGIGSIEGNVAIYSLLKEEIIYQMQGDDPITILCFLQNSQEYITGNQKGKVNKFQIEKTQPIQQWKLGMDILSIEVQYDEKSAESAESAKRAKSALVSSSNCWVYKIYFDNDEIEILNEEISYDNLEISKNGTCLATTKNGNLYLWNLKNQMRKDFPKIHDLFISAICFSENGKMIATGGDENVIHLWQVNKKNELKRKIGTFYGHLSLIKQLLYFKSLQYGEIIVSASLDLTVRVWDIKELNQIQCYLLNTKVSIFCQFNQTNKIIFQYKELEDNKIFLEINFDNKQKNQVNFKIQNQLNCITISNDDQIIALSTIQMELILIKGGNMIIKNFDFKIKNIQFSFFDKQLLYVQKNQTLIVYNIESESEVPSNFNLFEYQLISFSKGESMIAYCQKQELGVIDLQSQRNIFQLKSIIGTATSFSSHKEYIAIGKDNGEIVIQEIRSSNVFNFYFHKNKVIFLKFKSDYELISAGWDQNIYITDFKWGTFHSLIKLEINFQMIMITNDQIIGVKNWYNSKNQTNNMGLLEFSQDSEQLAFTNKLGQLQLYNIQFQKARTQFSGENEQVTAISFSEDGFWFAYGNYMNQIILQKKTNNHESIQHTNKISSLRFYKDQFLIYGSIDMVVYIYNLNSKQIVEKIDELFRPIMSITCSSASQNIAICGMSNKIVLLNLKQMKNYSFEAHASRINAVEISPCGENLVSVSDDCCIKFWKICSDQDEQSYQCFKTIGQNQQFEANQVLLQDSVITNSKGESLLENFIGK